MKILKLNLSILSAIQLKNQILIILEIFKQYAQSPTENLVAAQTQTFVQTESLNIGSNQVNEKRWMILLV